MKKKIKEHESKIKLNPSSTTLIPYQIPLSLIRRKNKRLNFFR